MSTENTFELNPTKTAIPICPHCGFGKKLFEQLVWTDLDCEYWYCPQCEKGGRVVECVNFRDIPDIEIKLGLHPAISNGNLDSITLNEHLIYVDYLRKQLATKKTKCIQAQGDLEVTKEFEWFSKYEDERDEIGDVLEKSIEALRELAVEQYNDAVKDNPDTGKKLCDGAITIKFVSDVSVTDETQQKIYCAKSLPDSVSIKKGEFNRTMRAIKGTNLLPSFVTITENPTATIAGDLSEYVKAEEV